MVNFMLSFLKHGKKGFELALDSVWIILFIGAVLIIIAILIVLGGQTPSGISNFASNLNDAIINIV